MKNAEWEKFKKRRRKADLVKKAISRSCKECGTSSSKTIIDSTGCCVSCSPHTIAMKTIEDNRRRVDLSEGEWGLFS